MFNLNEFIMKTLKGMIGNEVDYKVQEYALSWYNRGTLNEENLAEIDSLIETKNNPVEEDVMFTEEIKTTENTTIDLEATDESDVPIDNTAINE